MIGQTLGHYRIVEQIGAGGMGVVYRARDEHLPRDVALKILKPEALSDPDARHRFRDEAIGLSRLNHPNIATIHDFLTEAGTDFLVMEFIPGKALDDYLAGQPLGEPEVLRLGSQMLDGLAAAHDAGVIHRDLKPGNLRVTPDGRLKVLDFGLAALSSTAWVDETTRPAAIAGGRPMGTLPYMAPEVLQGASPDARSDIYGAGTVLYQMLTGRPPFTSTDAIGLVMSILSDPVPSPREHARVSAGMNALVTRALEKEPARRYQSARDVLRDLQGIGRGRPRTGVLGRVLVAAAIVLFVAFAAWRMVSRTNTTAYGFSERDWALISDFDNRTPDPNLARTLRTMLDLSLQQSSYVNLLSRERVFGALGRMKRTPGSGIDEATGLEICRREGARVLFTGFVAESGSSLLVTVQAIDVASGALVFVEREQLRSRDDLFARVDVLAQRVRTRLGESIARIQQSNQPLAQVTTSSMPALEAYSAAADAMALGRVDEALARLTSALELDADFAMAHRLIAGVFRMSGNRAREVEHIDRAYGLRREVTARERHLIEAGHATAHGQYERAVDSLQLLVHLYPDDVAARQDLAAAYHDVRAIDQSIEQTREVIRLNPFAASAYGDLVLLLVRAGRYDEAVRAAQTAAGRGLENPRLDWSWGLALAARGEVGGAMEHFSRMERAGDTLAATAQIAVARAAILQGRLAEAERRLVTGLRSDVRLGQRYAELLRRYLLSRIHQARGETRLARHQIDAILGGDAASLQVEDLRRAGAFLAQSGEVGGAVEVLGRLDQRRRDTATAFNESAFLELEGEVALAQGRLDVARQRFEAADAEYPRVVARQGLARVYARARDSTRAEQHWQRVVASGGEILLDDYAGDWLNAMLEVARIQVRKNETGQARESYARFLRWSASADDVGLYRAARREWRQLTGTVWPDGASAAREGPGASHSQPQR